MAHLIRPVATKSKSGGFTPVPVPEDVASELAELFTYLQENPGQLAFATFDSKAERDEFVNQAKSWAAVTEGVEFRQSPSKGLEDTELKFNLRPPLTEAEREANRKANEAKKAKEAKAKGGKAKVA